MRLIIDMKTNILKGIFLSGPDKVAVSARNIITLTNNAVSLLLAFVLNHHKPMDL